MAIDKRVRDNIPTTFLPPHDVLVPGANNDDPSDEHDIEYNAKCNEIIKAKLAEVAERNAAKTDEQRAELDRAGLTDLHERPMIRTRYPKDDNESEDIVSLDRDGEIVVLDAGTR